MDSSIVITPEAAVAEPQVDQADAKADEKAPEQSSGAQAAPSKACNYCKNEGSLFLHRDAEAKDAPLRSVCVDCFVKVFDTVLGKPLQQE